MGSNASLQERGGVGLTREQQCLTREERVRPLQEGHLALLGPATQLLHPRLGSFQPAPQPRRGRTPLLGQAHRRPHHFTVRNDFLQGERVQAHDEGSGVQGGGHEVHEAGVDGADGAQGLGEGG